MCDDVKRDEKGYLCNQCLLGWYMYNNRCYQKCPEGTISDKNMVCKEINSNYKLTRLYCERLQRVYTRNYKHV